MALNDIDLTFLGNSICKKCVFRLSRHITPFNFEEYDFTDDALALIEDLEDDDIDAVIEEHICLLLKELLDCEVMNCNFYKDANTPNVFNTIVQNTDIFRS